MLRFLGVTCFDVSFFFQLRNLEGYEYMHEALTNFLHFKCEILLFIGTMYV